jgi:hypothetical protein
MEIEEKEWMIQKIEEREYKDKEKRGYNAAGVRVHDRKERKWRRIKKREKEENMIQKKHVSIDNPIWKKCKAPKKSKIYCV